MAHRRQAVKALRQSKKRHTRNKRIKTDIKETLKKLNFSVLNKNIEDAKKWLTSAISKLSKASKKGLIHKNTARRRISRLSKKIAKLK